MLTDDALLQAKKTQRMISGAFPHKTLIPEESFPRINLETARKLVEGLDKLRDIDDKAWRRYTASPAICVAVFAGPLVKWVVNENEAADTLRNIEQAIEKAKHQQEEETK